MRPPTLEETAESIASAYLIKKSKKQLIPRSQEQWNVLLKKIIAEINNGNPEKNEEFLENIPEMHRCWAAIAEIGQKKYLAEIYALVMTKIYKGASMPFEIEKIILALDDEELIWQLAKKDYLWSHRAQHIMLHLHPKAYERVFAEEHDSMAIIFA